MRYPCTWPHPAFRRYSSWACVSTPSATTPSPSPRAIAICVATSVGSPAVEIADEASIDLQLVELVVPEAAQRRVPRSEVVDGQPYPKSLERPQCLVDRASLARDQTLGDFQGQAVGFETMLAQSLCDHADELGFELASRQIHRNAQRQWAGVCILPTPQLPTRLIQDPCTDRNNQSRLFGHGEERIGQQQAPRRVLPSQQCLGACEAIAFQSKDRLEHQSELVAIERLTKLIRKIQPTHRPDVHCRARSVRSAICRAPWRSTSPGRRCEGCLRQSRSRVHGQCRCSPRPAR